MANFMVGIGCEWGRERGKLGFGEDIYQGYDWSKLRFSLSLYL